jgi:RimK family alpha-L-glutamate ligase
MRISPILFDVTLSEVDCLKIGIIGRDIDAWGTVQLRQALEKRGISPTFLRFSSLAARVDYRPILEAGGIDVVRELKAVIVRPIGRGSLEEIIFRMDVLHRIQRQGVPVVNPPRAIERCADKYYALALLEESKLPVPRTLVTESVEEGLRGFRQLGSDVVLKPLFGSRGVGATRILDENVATRIFRTIRFHRDVLYIQEFIPHGASDIRAFVVGDHVVAAMRRVGDSWKTNISQGAQPVAIRLDEKLEALAVKATKVLDCKIAGVDILEREQGPLIVELNSQPGWRGLQSVTKTNIADSIIDYVLSEVRK